MFNLNNETLKIVSNAMDGESDAFEQLVVLFTDTVKTEIKRTLSKNDFYKILYSGIEVAIEDIATEVWRVLYSRAQSRDLRFETYESFSNYLAIVCRHRAFRYMAVRIRHRTKKGKGLDQRNANSDDSTSEKLIVDRRFTDRARKMSSLKVLMM